MQVRLLTRGECSIGSRLAILCYVALALIAAGPAHAASVANGSFEAGTAPWVLSDLATPFQPLAALSVGTATSLSPFLAPNVVLPTDGDFALNHGFDGSAGVISVAQDIGPVLFGDVVSFDYRAGWDLITYAPPGALDREFFVEIQPAGGGAPLANYPVLTAAAFTDTGGGPNSDTGALSETIDLSSFAGQAIRIDFKWNIPDSSSGPANFQLDHVRIDNGSATKVSSLPMTFSIDFQGPMIGVPDLFLNLPIGEGDILTPAPLGPPGPNAPLPGFGVLPPMIEVSGLPGGQGMVDGGLGIQPGIFGCVELDALSYGRDVADAGSVGAFSVDEFAVGGIGSIATPVPPDVLTEGALGANEASADVFAYLGPLAPTAPGSLFTNTAAIDGNGFSLSGLPGIGLYEANPPTLGEIPDPGDNLDALDLGTTFAELAGPIFFSLDSNFPDPLENVPGVFAGGVLAQVNCGTALGNGFSGSDVLGSFPGATPWVAIPAAALGLDLFGADTDDLDALTWNDADDSWTLTPPDTIAFSVRRGSAVIGQPDSQFGLPIEEGDVLTPPIPPSPLPAILISAEALGLSTIRSGVVGPFGFGDDVDAIDVPEPGFGLQFAAGLAWLAMFGHSRRKK
jgi:hypothetical protein